jgi:endonuclease I
MNQHIKRAALVLAVLLLICSLCLPSFAAPASYSTSKNSGVRDEVCETLDGTSADAYYTQNYTYESLSQLSEAELLSSLRTLMTSTHKKKTSYNDCRDMSVNTDCQNADGSIVLLYTSVVVKRSDFIGSGSIGWNREHVWPKSLGGFGNEGAGADLHHVRPDDVTTNAVRANDKYGNVTGGKDVKGSSLVSGAVGGKSGGGYFEPLDNVKGDVARICLYVYVRYGGELSQCNKITNVFQSVDVLLQWCALDPVDTWEMGRNEVVGAIQGNRNVFIDYPEYAWLLFGKELPADMTTPSGMAKNSTPDVPDDPIVPDVPTVPDEPCKHEQTVVRGAIAASCTKEGYTGDTYCASCDEKLATGRVISTEEGHKFSDWIDDGYGNLSRICTDCAMMQYDESNGNNNQPTTPPTTGEQPTGGCKSALFVSLSPMLPAIAGAWLFLRKKERK